MNPYEQHRQNQFHAGCGLSFVGQALPLAGNEESLPYSETYSGWPASEPCVVISEASARAIVAAIDDKRPHKAALLIKALPWFASILSGVRATRHLDPTGYQIL